jgi:hypothetical protein
MSAPASTYRLARSIALARPSTPRASVRAHTTKPPPSSSRARAAASTWFDHDRRATLTSHPCVESGHACVTAPDLEGELIRWDEGLAIQMTAALGEHLGQAGGEGSAPRAALGGKAVVCTGPGLRCGSPRPPHGHTRAPPSPRPPRPRTPCQRPTAPAAPSTPPRPCHVTIPPPHHSNRCPGGRVLWG